MTWGEGTHLSSLKLPFPYTRTWSGAMDSEDWGTVAGHRCAAEYGCILPPHSTFTPHSAWLQVVHAFGYTHTHILRQREYEPRVGDSYFGASTAKGENGGGEGPGPGKPGRKDLVFLQAGPAHGPGPSCDRHFVDFLLPCLPVQQLSAVEPSR